MTHMKKKVGELVSARCGIWQDAANGGNLSRRWKWRIYGRNLEGRSGI